MVKVDYQEQLDHFEQIKKRRFPSHPCVRAFAQPKLDIVLRSLGIPPDRAMTMLEVGAGNGHFSYTLDKAFDLVCLDFSQNMLDMNPVPAERKKRGDAEHLPYDDDAFDIVFCANLLHHMNDPLVAVREMRRVARHHVVLVEPNILNPLMFGFGLIKPEERGSLKFTAAYVKQLGEQAGLRIRDFASHGAVVPNKTPRALLPVLRTFDRTSRIGFYHIGIFDV